MKLGALKRSNTFVMNLMDDDGETMLPITITGYKKRSNAFQAIEAKHNPPPEKTKVMFKGSVNFVETKNLSPEQQMAIAVESVTAINGIDGFETTPDNVLNLFKSPDTEWIYFQWREALESSGKNSTT